MHRYAMLDALVRRGVNLAWAVAAVRIQRMPRITLRVKGAFTSTICRRRGAITGNCLAALFGRMLVEDVFAKAHDRIRSFIFRHESVELFPMAWSDNVLSLAMLPDMLRKHLRFWTKLCGRSGNFVLKRAAQRLSLHPLAGSVGIASRLGQSYRRFAAV